MTAIIRICEFKLTCKRSKSLLSQISQPIYPLFLTRIHHQSISSTRSLAGQSPPKPLSTDIVQYGVSLYLIMAYCRTDTIHRSRDFTTDIVTIVTQGPQRGTVERFAVHRPPMERRCPRCRIEAEVLKGGRSMEEYLHLAA